MANINDYVEHYKNETTQSMGFNEIDGLVLSELAYIDWKGVVPETGESGSITLGQAVAKLRQNEEYYNSLTKDFQKLLTNVEQSERFSSMKMSNYEDQFQSIEQVANTEEIIQFQAVTFSFDDTSSSETQNFVAFRGTDERLEGWHEDFNMAFDMDTQAQIAAKEYLNYIGHTMDGQIRVGGHSKGGNDTCYAYLYCDEEVRKKIVKLYSYDGPGLLNDQALENERYQDMLDLLQGSAIAPYDSVIGLLLNENGFIFTDTNTGIFMDHDAFSWQINVEDSSFIEKEQSFLSKLINETVDELVHVMDPELKKILIDSVWRFIYAQNVESFDDFLALAGEEKLDILVDLYSSDELDLRDKAVITATIAAGLLIAAGNAIELGFEEAVAWVEAKTQEFIVAIDQKITEFCETIHTKLKDFYVGLKQAVIIVSQKAKHWLNMSFNAGYRYSEQNPFVKVNTGTLRTYASRLSSVQRRLVKLDNRLDGLYWQVGLKDLWNLMQADILTGYNWRLSRCASYLTNTAEDFESIERALANKL